MQGSRSFVRGAGLWLLILALAASCLWALWEQDIYWQVRAGNDFLTHWSWPETDQWSYTAAGTPWYNVEWLSTVLIALAHRAGGIPALIVLRAATVALLLFVVEWLVRQATGRRQLVWSFFFLPVTLVIAFPRLQVRPDLFVLVAEAALVGVWLTDWSETKKCAWSCGLVVLATNLHPGSATFLVATAVTFLVATAKRPGPASLGVIGVTMAFFTLPYPTKVPAFLWRHLLYAQHTVMNNPDHLSLTWNAFDISQALWLLCTVIAAVFMVLPRFRRGLPAAYQSWWVLPTLVLFTALSFNRIRAIPYQFLFILPVLASWAGRRATSWGWSLAALALVQLWPWQLYHDPKAYGFGLAENLFPTGSAAFIKSRHLEKNLLHMPAFGDFVLGNLPDYPVYFDARETPFDEVQAKYQDLFNSPGLVRELVTKYQIRTALVSIKTLMLPVSDDAPNWSRRYTLFPPEEWAVVYFDQVSVLLVAKTPAHGAVVQDHEYRLVVPDIPPWVYLQSKDRTPATDARFELEMNRCLQDEPANGYCLMLKSYWLSQDGSPEAYEAARRYLEDLRTRFPDEPNVGVALAKVLRRLGKRDDYVKLLEDLPAGWRAEASKEGP